MRTRRGRSSPRSSSAPHSSSSSASAPCRRSDRGDGDAPLLWGRARIHLAVVRHDRRRHGLRVRLHLGQPHQPRRHPRPGRHRQVPVDAGSGLPHRAGARRDRRLVRDRRRARAARRSISASASRRSTRRSPRYRGALRGVHRHVHPGVRGLRRDPPQGGARVGRPRDRSRRVRGDHPGRSGDRRLDQPGPHHRPDDRAVDPRRRGRTGSSTGSTSSPSCSAASSRRCCSASSRTPRPTRSRRLWPRRSERMKKLINAPDDVLAEALVGVEAAHPDLRVDHANRIIYRGDAEGLRARSRSSRAAARATSRSTAASSGLGMLDAACAGEVFTSPTPDQMLEATKVVDRGAGVLHIVKNYTGDVMNFEMGSRAGRRRVGRRGRVGRHERRRRGARTPPGRPAVVASASPCCSRRSSARPPRRGATSRPSRRSPARSTSRAARWAWRSRAARCRRQASRRSTCRDDEMEMGVGIHGEPGRHRVPLAPASDDRRAARRADPRRPRLHVGSVDRHAQRPGRLAAHRAVPDVRRGREAAREGRGERRAQPGRQLHHLARHGRAARSRCSRRMTSCSACGMLPSTPPACAGAPERSTETRDMNGTDRTAR